MSWTTKIPTTPGWKYWRWGSKSSTWFVRDIVDMGRLGLGEDGETLEQIGGEWWDTPVPAPVKEKETHPSGHRYNSVEDLIKDIPFKEPPAPDISKGVWYGHKASGVVVWTRSPDEFGGDLLSTVMVDGETFVREDQPYYHNIACQKLVRQLAAWCYDKTGHNLPEWKAIEVEAKRLHPETKGE